MLGAGFLAGTGETRGANPLGTSSACHSHHHAKGTVSCHHSQMIGTGQNEQPSFGSVLGSSPTASL